MTWQHINHDDLVRLQQNAKSVDDVLRLKGKALVEDFEFSRVLVGKIPIEEISALFTRHGDLLLEKNVRRFLGLKGKRVNQDIARTLKEESERGNFYFYNNGITLVCDKFSYNGLQNADYQVQVQGLQVINGGQTCKTIQNTLSELAGSVQAGLENAFVLVRLYELPSESNDLVRSITYATNSQNPVDLRDLRSNDVKQKSLALGLQNLGYTYQRYRSDTSLNPLCISSGVAATAILSIWRERPHQGKTQGKEHFGKLYELIFSDDLNANQLLLATLIFRFSEKKRRKAIATSPPFLSYASHFIAMLIGRYLLKDLNMNLGQMNHKTFDKVKSQFETQQEDYFQQALQAIDESLKHLYADPPTLQRLASTFRRGDLLELLKDEGKDA